MSTSRSSEAASKSRQRITRKYRRRAAGYDRAMDRTAAWRLAAVETLGLEPGQVVVDVACGTGANFEAILERIGPDGRLIGFDLSPEMLALAEARISSQAMHQVTLIEAAAEEVMLAGQVDAALFSFTHDVLQSETALGNITRQLRPEARVAAVGVKQPSAWNLPFAAAVWLSSRRYVTRTANLSHPWGKLESRARLEVETFAAGAIYLAQGVLRPGQGAVERD